MNTRRQGRWRGLALAVSLALGSQAAAETGANAWLRYAAPPDPPRYHDMPHAVLVLGSAPEEAAAADELDRGLGHMIGGVDVVLHRFRPDVDAIVLGTQATLAAAHLKHQLPGLDERPLPEEGFRLQHIRRGVRQWWVIQGGSPRAELYGAFRLVALVAQDRQLPEQLTDAPAMPLRWVSQWDRPDGSVPHGYAGASIFFEEGGARTDLARVGDLARLLSSAGINGLVLGDPLTGVGAFTPGLADDLQRISRELQPWGVRLAVSVNAGTTPAEIDWLYAALPQLAGVAVTEPPSPIQGELDRLAAALSRHGGVLLIRAPDPASPPHMPHAANAAAVLPGGPSAFALRLPLPAVRGDTPSVAELDLSNTWTGQGRHTVYLPPLWPALHLPAAPLRRGAVAIVNAGEDANWTHDPMQMANLYAFGRMTWDPALTPADALEEWTRMTWSNDARIGAPMQTMLLSSAAAYENYTVLFGLGQLVPEPETAPVPYGPVPRELPSAPDRIGTARPGLAAALGISCEGPVPDDLLLALCRVPYSRPLRGDRLPELAGEPVLQAIYDRHYAGVAAAQGAVDTWDQLRSLVDEPRFDELSSLLAEQAASAEVWRDSVNESLLRTSGIPDALGFVGRHASRIEAEALPSTGFRSVNAAAGGVASAGYAAICAAPRCALHTVFHGEANVYRIEVGYFDRYPGAAHYRLLVNAVEVAHWRANRMPPDATGAGAELDGTTAARFVVNGVRLAPGDTLTLEAVPDGADAPAVDFLEITRDPRWN